MSLPNLSSSEEEVMAEDILTSGEESPLFQAFLTQVEEKLREPLLQGVRSVLALPRQEVLLAIKIGKFFNNLNPAEKLIIKRRWPLFHHETTSMLIKQLLKSSS
jgi:hypothetical protein